MSSKEYLEWREQFARAWRTDHAFMALLSPDQQWDIHTYLQFHADKAEEEALSWHLTVLACDPEIEELALTAGAVLGQSAARLNELAHQQPLPFTEADFQRAGVMVSAIVEPEPDVAIYVRALIELARQDTKNL